MWDAINASLTESLMVFSTVWNTLLNTNRAGEVDESVLMAFS
jgi:hypothetical protein